MSALTREAETDDERDLWWSTYDGEIGTINLLLQKGVCPNIFDHVI